MSNTNNPIKRLSLIELRTNMVLARDAVNRAGEIILHANTILTVKDFYRLVDNNIENVYVREQSINLNSPTFDKIDLSFLDDYKTTEEKEEFLEFQATYQKKTEEIKESLLAISEGDIIDMDQLYKLTDNVMSKLKYKNDVFSYLVFLKDTDEHTYSHSNNVSLLCNLFGKWIDMSQDELITLTTAGVLHDIGKTKLNLDILNKPGKLTDEEFAHIKLHPVLGYRLLEYQKVPESIKLAALMHHEKIDGSGYPIGAKAQKIDRISKIVTICDIYDAMTANRVYRGKICPFNVIKSFEQSNYGLLDTEFLLIFLQNISYTYVGSWVQLSDGTVAQVSFINKAHLSRPILTTASGQIFDLTIENDLSIVKII